MPRKSRAEHARRAAAFRRGLLRWYRRHGRDLPWRRTRDPYHVVVSEFMLQQTQVARVEAYYHRFLERYPTIEALAAAPPHAVRESWEGLGYYRRAANLHRLARTVVERHAGVLPSDISALEQLPGVGRYTAGAVACFAYERVAATVDTNVARVIRRVFHPRLAEKPVPKRVWATALEILPREGKRAWEVNQALMELGALVCTARIARCAACPVRGVCGTGSVAGKGKSEGGKGARSRCGKHMMSGEGSHDAARLAGSARSQLGRASAQQGCLAPLRRGSVQPASEVVA